MLTQPPPGQCSARVKRSKLKSHGRERPDAPPPAQAEPRSGCPNGMLVFCPLQPVQTTGMTALECSSKNGWAFMGAYLAGANLGKPILRAAPDHLADVAIWTGLAGAARSPSEASQNVLCDRILCLLPIGFVRGINISCRTDLLL